MPNDLTIRTEPEALDTHSQASSDSRPSMTVFDSSPNARSKTLTTVDGEYTYGNLNQIPNQPGSYTVGVHEAMGNRRSMEDAYAFVVDFAGIQGQGYFAIFDGHAGKHAAEWCGKNFHDYLLRKLIEQPETPIPETFADTFEIVDKELTKISETTTTSSGCTAVTAFIRLEDENGHQSFAPPIAELTATKSVSRDSSRAPTPTSSSKRIRIRNFVTNAFSGGASASNGGKLKAEESDEKPPVALSVKAPRRVLYMANVGDARAVLGRGGKALRLTYDHKGNDKKEVKRIQEAGGFVLNNRVNGVLAVTRSLGDSAMKDFVVGKPFTSEVELTEQDDHLIIACDGLWDVIDDQAAIDLIRDSPSAQEAAKTLVTYALENFSNDNVTVLVVKLQTGKGAKADSASVKLEDGVTKKS